MPALAQELGDQRRVFSRIAKDDRAVGLLDLEHAHQIARAPHAAHHVIGVLDLVHADEVGRELDLLRLAHVARADALDVVGDRRREEHRLPILRALLDDLGDLLEEAHRQHLVGLVEHQDLEPVEPKRAAPQMIEHAPRRARHDLRARLELLDLLAHRRAAVDGDDVQLVGARSSRTPCPPAAPARASAPGRAPALPSSRGSMSPCANGMPNAAVLPEPVRDCTMTSLPAIMRGKTARCTGIGSEEPHLEEVLPQLGFDAELLPGLQLARGRCARRRLGATVACGLPLGRALGRDRRLDGAGLYFRIHSESPRGPSPMPRRRGSPRGTLLFERLARRFERVPDVLDP